MFRSFRLKVAALAVLISLTLSTGCSNQASDQESTPSSNLGSPASDKVELERGLGGWGPERATFTDDRPADHPVFNSITGGSWGDERNFFQVKESGAPNTVYSDALDVSPGKNYTGIIRYSNAASPSVKTPARNTKIQIQAPGTMTGVGGLSASISSDNTEPAKVWDGAVLRLSDPTAAVALRYVQDSAIIHTRGKLDGQKMPESIFSEGAQLGCDSFDGTLDGKGECAGYVTFEFRVDQPNFTVTALAAPPGNSSLAPAAEVKVGDTVTIRAEYKNTGTTQQDNVVLKVANLPQGMQMEGSPVLVSNSTTNGYTALNSASAGRLAKEGINVGSYAPGASCYIKFKATIADVPGHDFGRDGQIYTYPTIAAETNNGTKQSGVKVLVYGHLQ